VDELLGSNVIVIGLVVVGGLVGLAFVVRLLAWWWGGLSQVWNPQFVVHTTARTPLQIAVGGCLRLVILIVVILGISVYMWGGETVRRLAVFLLNWMIDVLRAMVSVLE